MSRSKRDPEGNSTTQAVKWDQNVIMTSILLMIVAVFAWVSTINHALSMSMPMAGPDAEMAGAEMSSMGSPAVGFLGRLGLSWSDAIPFLLAWGVMMAAMMLPSATPMIAFYGAVRRRAGTTGERGISTALFVLVYVVLWLLFGLPVYVASRLVETAAMSNAAFAAAMPYLLALALIGAGGFQFTRLKEVCLQACQHPMMFLMKQWRSGYRGTLRLAVKHAGFCIVCCWALMVVMVALGAMALHWMLLFSVIIAAEKLIPRGRLVAHIFGGLLVVGGVLILIQPGLAPLLRGMGM